MKQILLLVAIHLLIFHQYNKDKKEQKFFKSTKSAVAINKEQKKNLSILLEDLKVSKQDSFLFVTGPTRYNFTDYSFLFKKTGNMFNGTVQKKNTWQGQTYYRPF
jgi:hypothetical protein